jgi:uncharacterized protein
MNQKELLLNTRKAIKSGDINLVRQLIENNDELINAMTPFGTWLHVASAHGQLAIVKFLLEKGMDINANGGTFKSGAINEAAFRGHLDIVKYLCEKGAKFDLDSFNSNPLISAIYNNHLDVAIFLIDNGIDITVGYNVGSLENVDACEYARQYGRREIQEYLMEKLGRK